MNRNELKKIMSDFSSISHRLLEATYSDYLDVLRRMLIFVESNELIFSFIEECGGFDACLEETVDDVIEDYHSIFKFSVDEREEIVEIFSIIKIICNREYKELPYGLVISYSSSNNFADKLKEFNHNVVFVFINHINNYLRKVGIDMGLDNNVTYNINGTQVNFANDNATINAVQNNNGINADELKKLITAMRVNLDGSLSDDDKADAHECIDAIETELSSAQPNEKTVKEKFRILKGIDTSVKFASACCSLLTFADKVHPFIAQIIPWFQNLI